ncbi:flavin-containing monooxygenase 5-like [Ciona intestinalis]
MSKKRVAVIGAGASGLTAIKCCLDEDLDPVCFEKSHDIGGLWRFEEDTKEGATVYRSTFINTSKELMSFSDFPLSKETPNYMHHSKVMQYYRDYADRFNLLKHIKFKTEVLSCEESETFNTTGTWRVKTRNILNDEINEEIFDGVLVAVGHHASPHFPLSQFPGADKFQGRILHSHDYRDFKGFENKKVVVLGMGNSGGDIAVELSWHSKQVFLSTRRGSWVFNRVGPRGYPIDLFVTTRYKNLLDWLIPKSITQKSVEKMLTEKLDHAHYGLKPEHGPFNQHPFINDELPNRIIIGSIVIKSNIRSFKERSVVFDDGTEEEVDVVIFATGYVFEFPFLHESIAHVNGTDAQLYKYMWPLSMKRNTLAIIGHVQVLGAVNPVSEMQCRWATRVFKDIVQLPSDKEMIKDIDKKRKAMKQKYYNSQRHTIEVPHIDYMDEIALKIGVKPNLFSLFFTDYQLARKIFYEISSAYQFRLVGAGKWAGARRTIMEQKMRMLHPLHTRPLPNNIIKRKKRLLSTRRFLWVVVLSVASYYAYTRYK